MKPTKLMKRLYSKGYTFLQHEYAKFGKPFPRKRLFVRGLSSFTYSLRGELKRVRKVPRVIKGKDLKFNRGPQYFNADILTPKAKTSQVLFAHYVVLAPAESPKGTAT